MRVVSSFPPCAPLFLFNAPFIFGGKKTRSPFLLPSARASPPSRRRCWCRRCRRRRRRHRAALNGGSSTRSAHGGCEFGSTTAIAVSSLRNKRSDLSTDNEHDDARGVITSAALSDDDPRRLGHTTLDSALPSAGTSIRSAAPAPSTFHSRTAPRSIHQLTNRVRVVARRAVASALRTVAVKIAATRMRSGLWCRPRLTLEDRALRCSYQSSHRRKQSL